MIQQAVDFAVKAHYGAVRKGTKIPYITHPLETSVIVSLITDDEELIAAALLHDVMEDAGVSYEELKRCFGERVANLVRIESEDKSKTWEERKSRTVERLKDADRQIKILTLGDKLSNIRCTARDYLAVGDAVWLRFRRTEKSYHGWYYWGIAMDLRELKDFPAYQEYVGLCTQVFGPYEENSRRPF